MYILLTPWVYGNNLSSACIQINENIKACAKCCNNRGFDNVLALLEDIANGRIRNERVFRDYYDFLAHDDDWLISRFRFPRAILLEICTELGPGLERQTARSHALPVPIQVLTTLGFLATGSFQRELTDRSGMSQGALSRAIPAVLNGIIRISARYIRFPYDAVNQANIKAQFAESRFSQCNRSDRLHTHCYKDAI